MNHYRRDAEELRRALRDHRIMDYPLQVPVFEHAWAVKSSTTVGPRGAFTGVVVRPTRPISFDEFARRQNWSAEKLDIHAWLYNLRRFTTPSEDYTAPLKMLPGPIQKVLEEGGKASMRDVQEWYLMEQGCLDLDFNVTCFSFDHNVVSIPLNMVKRGQVVEFFDKETQRSGWPGRVAGTETDPEDGSKVVLVELFEPTPFLNIPFATAPHLIKPGFFSSKTWVLGKGTAKAMEKAGELLPGDWDVEWDGKGKDPRKLYYLKEPLDLSVVQEFCARQYPDKPHCVWHALMMYVIPIHPEPHKAAERMHQGGVFRPVPEDALEGLETEVMGLED